MSFSENSRKNFEPIKCSICRGNINDMSTVYQTSFSLSIVCRECCEKFSKEDIELISNIFLSHGGYFGEHEDSMASIEDIVRKIIKKIENGPKKIELNELNVKLLHEALLHGFTPKRYIKGLQNYLEE